QVRTHPEGLELGTPAPSRFARTPGRAGDRLAVAFRRAASRPAHCTPGWRHSNPATEGKAVTHIDPRQRRYRSPSQRYQGDEEERTTRQGWPTGYGRRVGGRGYTHGMHGQEFEAQERHPYQQYQQWDDQARDTSHRGHGPQGYTRSDE